MIKVEEEDRLIKCAKFTLIISNIFILIGGIIIIALSVKSLHFLTLDELEEISNNHNININGTIIVISLGVLIILLAFLGLLGVLKRTNRLLLSYLVVLFVTVIITLSCGVLAFLFNLGETKKLKDSMKLTMKEYKQNENLREAWDNFHSRFYCCGIIDPIKEWMKVGLQIIPLSCCPDQEKCHKNIIQIDSSDYYSIGCFDKLKLMAGIFGSTAFTISFLNLLGIIMTCILLK